MLHWLSLLVSYLKGNLGHILICDIFDVYILVCFISILYLRIRVSSLPISLFFMCLFSSWRIIFCPVKSTLESLNKHGRAIVPFLGGPISTLFAAFRRVCVSLCWENALDIKLLGAGTSLKVNSLRVFPFSPPWERRMLTTSCIPAFCPPVLPMK